MSYVETSTQTTTPRVPSVLADMHKAHKERQERIKAAAYAEKVKEAAEIDDQQVAILEKSWEERQKDIPVPKDLWFSVVEETTPTEARRPRVDEIQHVICRYFTIHRNDLLSPRRDRRVSHPRQIAMYLAKAMTVQSHPEICRRFNRSDHTTSLYAFRKIEALIKTDWTVAYDVAHLEMML